MTYSDKHSIFHRLYHRFKIHKPENTTDNFKIKDDRAYFLYKNNYGSNKSFLKYGMIVFYEKDHSYLYFLPISITTKEQWDAL